MKKFLIVGIILAIIAIGTLSYLLFFTDQETGPFDTFSDLNFGDITDETIVAPIDDDPAEDKMLPEEPEVLIQISDTPVVGFREIGPATSSRVIYVEGGTGHVYQYDIEAATEERLSNITVRNPREAVVSPDGQYVAITSGVYTPSTISIVTLGDDEPSAFDFAVSAENIAILENNQLVYTVSESGNTIARQFDLPSLASRGNVFTIPFGEAVVSWGSNLNAIHYFYPKPSDELIGAAYAFDGSKIARLPMESYGISLMTMGDLVLGADAERQANILYNIETGVSFETGDFALPEKCSFQENNPSYLLCAVNEDFESSDDIAAWRKGRLISDDALALVDMRDLN